MTHTTDHSTTRAKGPNHQRLGDDRRETSRRLNVGHVDASHPSELHASHLPRLGRLRLDSPPESPHHKQSSVGARNRRASTEPIHFFHSIYPSESIIAPRELLRQGDSLKASPLERQTRTSRSQIETQN